VDPVLRAVLPLGALSGDEATESIIDALGFEEVQEAQTACAEGESLDRANLETRSEDVGALAHGRAARFCDGSRMSGDVQVRFCEGLGVRLPGPTHLVVLARYQGTRLTGWIETKIENWLGLEINRDKTRVVDLREAKASLDFLGYTFRWQDDRYGRNQRYLHVGPSKKALQSERDKISEMTDRRQSCTPIPRLIDKLNRQLKGWSNYFSLGYPRDAYRNINWHVGYRLANHLDHHRSQRPYQLPKEMSLYEHLRKLGLNFLGIPFGESR
jgi:RNA-directed DNA polymerase